MGGCESRQQLGWHAPGFRSCRAPCGVQPQSQQIDLGEHRVAAASTERRVGALKVWQGSLGIPGENPLACLYEGQQEPVVPTLEALDERGDRRFAAFKIRWRAELDGDPQSIGFAQRRSHFIFPGIGGQQQCIKRGQPIRLGDDNFRVLDCAGESRQIVRAGRSRGDVLVADRQRVSDSAA